MNSEKIIIKPRNPILAFFLAFLFTGFGQVYNGQIKKGLIFFSITFIMPFIFGLAGIGKYFYGFILVIIIDLFIRIYIILDAVKYAKKQKDYLLKTYNTWYYYLIIIAAIGTINWFYDYNKIIGVESYKIPTTSNEPTILVGDKVIGDLNAFNTIEPNYGDIVIFQKKDSIYPWIYRIVALPNDKLKIENNFLILNGKKCKTSFVRETKSEELYVNEYEEELPNGHKHKIFTFKKPFGESENTINEIIIPENSYFLIGDNRDNAMDSRYIGTIKREEIIAKVVFGYWGKSNDRININFRDK